MPEQELTPAQPGPGFYDISEATVLAAAQKKYGADVQVGPAYWLDGEVMRFSIGLDNGNTSFGANFHFKEGVFR